MDLGLDILLVLLDLTAAFGTVDHAILLDRLGQAVGIWGTALGLVDLVFFLPQL